MTLTQLTTDVAPLTIEQLNQQLATAVYRNHHDGVRRLVAAGANVNAMHRGDPLLHFAAVHAPQVVDLLLELGADVNQPNEGGQTLLGKAVGHGEVALRRTRYWLERGADPRHDGNRFGLHSAAFHADLDMVDLLLTYGADATVRNSNGQRAEDIAATRPGPVAVVVRQRLHRAGIEQERAELHQTLVNEPTDGSSPAPASRPRL